jgi:hypothetical protein
VSGRCVGARIAAKGCIHALCFVGMCDRDSCATNGEMCSGLGLNREVVFMLMVVSRTCDWAQGAVESTYLGVGWCRGGVLGLGLLPSSVA